MWVRSSASISDSIVHITTAVSTHILVLGESTVLVDSGIGAVSPRIIEELETFLGKDRALDVVCLTHAHFDHVGGVPYLRQHYPELTVLASPQTAELLSDKDLLKSLYDQNRECGVAMKFTEEMTHEDWVAGLTVDQIVRDGDTISLDDEVEIKVIGCPGHTQDSLCYLVRPDAALAGSEVLGAYYGRGKLVGCFTENYEDYVASIDKLCGLEIKALALPHCGLLRGELAGQYLLQLREEVERFRDQIRARLEEGELVEEIAASLYPEWINEGITPEGPFVASVKDTLEKMISVIAQDR